MQVQLEHMSSRVEQTYTATIYVGMKEGYDGLVHTQQEAEDILRGYCDSVGLCVTVTPINFIYTNGDEPGLAVGLINYPRFPDAPDGIRGKAREIGWALLAAMGQQRVSIVCPDETIMLLREAE